MALRDNVPGPDTFLPKQVVALADAIQSALNAIGVDTDASFVFDATNLWDNGYWISRTGYNQHSPLARAVFMTAASSVTVNVFMNGTPDAATAISIKVNGVLYASPVVPSSGANAIVQSLPAGSKMVEIISGVQVIPVSDPLGAFLISCTFNDIAQMLPPIATNRLVVYGDSNAQGGGGSPAVAVAWPGLYRNLTTRSVVVEALSGRSLHDDTNTGTLRTAFVSRITAIAPAELWIAMGTNDYNANKWSAASFGTAYAALLDDLHTALPNLRIYCQSPIILVTTGIMIEAANGSGSNLHAYRDQVRTVAEARSYCRYVEGLTIVSMADIRTDGLHVTDSGGARYAQFVADYFSNSRAPQVEPISVLEDVVWQNAVNVTTTTNSIQKTGGSGVAFDAGASSTKAIVGGNGGTRFTLTETNTTRVGGLSKGDAGQNYTEIDYGIAPQATGLVMGIFENGTPIGSGGVDYAAGDKAQVRVDYPNVYYERIRAGVTKVMQMSPTQLTSASYPLLLDTSLQATNATITDAKIFGVLQ